MPLPLIPVAIGAVSTSVATVITWFSLKYQSLNQQVQDLVDVQRQQAVKNVSNATGDALKQWLRPLGGYLVKAFTVTTVISITGILSTSLLGLLCLRELKIMRHEQREQYERSRPSRRRRAEDNQNEDTHDENQAQDEKDKGRWTVEKEPPEDDQLGGSSRSTACSSSTSRIHTHSK
ncbi:unnamed protein product [Amoebophrya sp. A25]|nr:unnamed protein product [Amoebophrya sp. A25]|eukprot:GSA25T00016895001.1